MPFRLSKSRFQTGLQCPKALWLQTHEPDAADPVPASRQYIFDNGTHVGELARERFADGVLVAEDHRQSAQALETTARLLQDPPPAIFEAALQHVNVFVRPDALVRVGNDTWDLYEVKSSTKVKPENITDVAVQTWVLEGAGLKIRRAYLMHLNNQYVFDGSEYDLDELFTAEDVTDEVRAWMPNVPVLVDELLDMLAEPTPPVPIGTHCSKPYECAFYGHCHAFLPDRPVTALPRINGDLLDALVADGIYAIVDVPSDYPGLTYAQREVCELTRTGECRIVGGVESSLAGLSFPIHFLDFESIMPALPLYANSRPYQQILFQWSDHVLHADGTFEHREFLFDKIGDPRRAFAESLIEATADAGSIVVYSAFENTRLGELARDLPDLARPIHSIQSRLFDLLPVVRKHVRHPDMLGSYSIKAALPALVDDLDYSGLEIAEGGTASREYQAFQCGQMSDAQAATLFENLRAYCATDTLAMVKVLDALRDRASV